MDAGVVGGLIGIGVMLCGISTLVLYEKGGVIVRKMKQVYHIYTHQRQPLVPPATMNPILVRLPSKQFQIKELVAKK